MIIFPTEKTLPKPPEGTPCNRCGLCCLVQPCGLAVALDLVQRGRCAALERLGPQFSCGLVTDPGSYVAGLKPWTGQWFGEKLGIGRGCCSPDDDPAMNNPEDPANA